LRVRSDISIAILRDVVLYLCKQYPHKHDLSKARLTKMVYLADWRSAIRRGRQITDIVWQFNHYGPYVDDVVRIARDDPAFEVVQDTNYYGGPKELIRVRDGTPSPSLDEDEREILDFVIGGTASKSWSDFMRLVYSTYPI